MEILVENSVVWRNSSRSPSLYYGWIRLHYSLDNDYSHIVCADRIIGLKQSASSLILGESFIRLGSTSTLSPLTIIIYCWLVCPPHCSLSGPGLPSTALVLDLDIPGCTTWRGCWLTEGALAYGGYEVQVAGCRLQVRVEPWLKQPKPLQKC